MERDYGGFRTTKQSGLLNLGVLGSIITGILLLGFIILLMNKTFLLLIIYGFFSLLTFLGFHFKTPDNRNMYSLLLARLGFRSKKKRVHEGFSNGFEPSYFYKKTNILTTKDSFNNEIALIQNKNNLISIPFRCNSVGSALLDNYQIENNVIAWGKFLENYNNLEMISVTTKTESTDSKELKQDIISTKDKNADNVSDAVINKLLENEVNKKIDTYINLVFRINKNTDISQIIYKIPNISRSLNEAGAGTVNTLTEFDIAHLYRSYFTREGIGRNIPFTHSGVGISVENKNYLMHDDYFSYSFYLTQPPRSNVNANILQQILTYSNDDISKSFTLFYRPLSTRKAMKAVESGRKDARFKASSSTMVTARSLLDINNANKIAMAEATGGVTDFSAILTLTSNIQNKEQVLAISEDLYSSCKFDMRLAKYNAEAGFCFNMPFGLVPWRYQFVGPELKEYI